jgi:nicotinate-nucleotide adenylyltransferase
MKCALFFGSFNPLHVGHLSIAEYVLSNCDVDEVRLVVSPQNPLKANADISEKELEKEARKRLEAVRKSVAKTGLDLKVSDVEFNMPKPSYTIRTMEALQKQEPDTQFIIVMGADNLAIMKRWFKWDEILSKFEVYVYPRPGFDGRALAEEYNRMDSRFRVSFLDAPTYDISSTQIREGEAQGKDMSKFKA